MVKNSVPGDRSSLSLAEFSPGVGQLERGPEPHSWLLGVRTANIPSRPYTFLILPLWVVESAR